MPFTPTEATRERRSARTSGRILLGLVALQAVGFALDAPMLLELGRIGAISAAHILMIVLENVLLLLGAVRLLLPGSRSPRYVFAASALFGFGALLNSPLFLVALTGTVLAAAGIVLSIRLPRKADGSS